MEDSWQLRGSTPRSSSQWTNWQGPVNQIDLGAGRYPNSYPSQDISLIERTARQDPTFSHLFSLNSQTSHARVGKSHVSHPMLAFTQESTQPLQCEFQQTASSRMAYMVPNQMWYSTTENGGWPLMTPGNPSFTGKAGPPVNSYMMADFAQGVQGVDVGHLSRLGGANKFDSAFLRQGGLEMYKQALNVNPHMGEVDVHSQYQLPSWQAASSYIEKQALLFKTSMHPVVEQPHRKPLQRPKVLCAGMSSTFLGGELTMSETGRLGVICSCHNVHMSVAKFSEHAGLFAANPGSSVIMEGGESLIQWRKTFFSQFGVKVPEDHMGWEWNDLNGKEGDNSTQKVAYVPGSCKEADFVLQGDCSLVKNSSSLHSSVGLGSSNLSNRRGARMGLTYADVNQSRTQNLGTIDSTVVEKSYKDFSGNELSENLALCQKAYSVTTRNQGTNSTHFFWGNETGPTAVTEQASFAKVASQSSNRINENSSAFSSGKKAVELCSGQYTSQNIGQLENDLATSNFELRLGQPSQQNLSLGSIYSDSLQSRGSCGPLSLVRPGSYELASQTAWEPNSNQAVNHSATGRPAVFDNFMGQGNGETYNTSWLCNSQKSRDFGMLQAGVENNKQPRNMHQVQSCTFPDVHTLQMFPNMGTDMIVQSSGNRAGNEQRTLELSSSDHSTFTALNAHPADVTKEAVSSCQSHQVSSLLVRPTVKNSEAVRNVDSMFYTPSERSRPLMGPPEMNVAASEASMLKNNPTQTTGGRSGVCESTLTTWAKQTPCFTNSESLSSCGPCKLHEGTKSSMICSGVDENNSQQQGLSVYAEIRHDREGGSLCLMGPAKGDVCTDLMHSDERSRDLRNQGVNHLNESSKPSQDAFCMSMNPPCSLVDSGSRLKNEGKAVTNKGSMVVEEQNLSEMAVEVCNHTELNNVGIPDKSATRAQGQDVKCKELSPDLLVVKDSSIEKVCLLDKGVTRSVVDAEAGSVGVDVTAPESPLSFRSPIRLDKASFDGSSVSAKMAEKRSSRTVCGNVDSTAKELLRNDVLDEGSGIGKCCSSIEADMEVMTSTGPISSHACVQALESQTSMANSSSSNAVISDTLSNSIRVRKLFTEVDKNATATHAEVQGGSGKSVQRIDKRGRKGLKWKGAWVASSGEGDCPERSSQMEDRGILKKLPTSDDTLWVLTTKGLKRKRSALSGPDLAPSKVMSTLTEVRSKELGEAQHILRWGGPKVSLRLPKETFGRQMKETILVNSSEKVLKPKRAKYQDLSLAFAVNSSSNLKARFASRKSKNHPFSKCSMRHRSGIADRAEVKSVKTASLSSLLEVPKAGPQSNKVFDTRCNMPFNSLQSRVPQTKFRQAGDLTGGGTSDVSAFCKDDVNAFGLSKLESRKRSSREMVARSSWENTVSGSQKMVPARKMMSISQASDLEKKMVTVPLKFIAEKRLEPEVLRKESKNLLISTAEHGSLSGGVVKRLRSQVTNARPVQYSPMLETESKGHNSNDEDDEIKPVRKRRKHRKRPKSTLTPKNGQTLVCCICGASMVQTNNVIVKCCRCGLGVHQACYGITEVTKKPWICRPCKAHANNIICVLCGYGGGAMTRAKKCGALAKGLVQAWRAEDAKIGVTSNSAARNTAAAFDHSTVDTSPCDLGSGHSDFKIQGNIKKGGETKMSEEEFKVARNIVADGIEDPTVTQWVHVVCALWMPGTRCINVETMAVFDVSGVATSARRSLCSICKRAGGACIKCRVPRCGTPFHPWCAHGKGLLQNEAFGGEDDKVGFYGKCLLHGNLLEKTLEEAPVAEPAPVAQPPPAPVAESFHDYGTCARTEGGYKRGETSFGKKVVDPASLGVLQEDVTAWLSRKEHRRSSRRFIKLVNSDVKTHYREYVRYKQEQGWKRLAVYKSSIHALGLYTSESIAKGEMVVEYVGEVIGLRVADKREADYLSNGRLQYRGACYLFRIDEENIIDATHKGGIARFVNHSCSPNCVAKIISVEKQKKVVFFAEKDIAAGEELTYDYKLDFETENRLPCYCKSAECRGYLN